MEFAIAIVVGLLLITWLVNQVNARHDKKRETAGPGPDARIAEAWDDFGISDDGAKSKSRFAKLLRKAPVERVESKEGLVRLALMAIRAENFEPLQDIAQRASLVA